MKICIDSGHGGSDPGAVGKTPFRLQEKDVTLNVAVFLEESLRARGHHTIMTRRLDRELSLNSRARFANRFDSDLFLSIHANAAAVKSAEGIEVFHYPGSSAGSRLARIVLESLLAALPDHRDRGVKEADFAVLRLTRMPAILVECEFISNPTQLRFLSKEVNQKTIASAIADGIANL